MLELGLCAVCRSAPAEAWWDPGRYETATCLECADAWLEREIAGEIGGERFAETLRLAHAEWAPPPSKFKLVRRDDDLDYSKLNELRLAWKRYEATVTENDRCWAVLADGSRCARVAAAAGVCETHAYMGCTLPGLGWAGGEPRGRMIARRGRRSA